MSSYRIEKIKIQVSDSNITFGSADRFSIYCFLYITMATSTPQANKLCVSICLYSQFKYLGHLVSCRKIICDF